MVKRGGASKFPVARIKKIMQADEDIGKVAQATPVVISKALELFLVDLVKSTAAETRSSGARKVTAYHLKRAVHTRETLDFLKEIVEKVPDPVQTEGSGRKRVGAGRAGKKEELEQEQEQEEGDERGGGQSSRYAYGATEEDSEEEEDEEEEEYEPEGRKGKKAKRE